MNDNDTGLFSPAPGVVALAVDGRIVPPASAAVAALRLRLVRLLAPLDAAALARLLAVAEALAAPEAPIHG